MNDLSPIIWKGRQWAVTEYGLETIGEPYHYYLTEKQISELGQGERAGCYDSLIHVMEKNWLDVDDFVTAYLVALTVHAIPPNPERVRDSLKAAMRERNALYGARPGQVPQPSGVRVLKLEDIDKYLPDPLWHGSQVLGATVGGAVEQPPRDDEGDD